MMTCGGNKSRKHKKSRKSRKIIGGNDDPDYHPLSDHERRLIEEGNHFN